MTSPLDSGAWMRLDQEQFGGFPSEDRRPGTSTGFGLFGTDPSTGPVLDTRGAFNPAFNGGTEHPAFEAETDPFRAVLPGLAKRARKGDAAAAAQYQVFYRTLDSKKRLYDLAYSTGLNDRNATDIMNHVFDSVAPEKFGGGTDQFRSVYARYLASQAKQRGTNARDLFASEQSLTDAFRTSFLPSLSAATGIARASGLKDLYGASDGMMANAGLFLKKGIAEWEAKNGLRDDATRVALMSRAAEYYAKCLSNPGLRALAGDAYSMVEAAAGEVGAVSGPRKFNKFDDYTRAVANLDRGFISYTGSSDSDRAAGYGPGTGNNDGSDGRTAAFWAFHDAYEKAYAANLTQNGGARNWSDATRAQLEADIAANLADVSPRAVAAGSVTKDGQSSSAWDNMIRSLAREAREMGEKEGVVDMNRLATRYVKDVKLPEPATVPQALGLRDAMQKIADDMVTWGIDERPVFRVAGSLRPQYDPKAIRARVEEQLAQLLGAPGVDANFAKDNAGFLNDVTKVITSYIGNANNVADSWAAGSGNVAEYRTGLKDRINALYMAEELRRRGVDVSPWWEPATVGEDFQVRGNTQENLRGIYGGLSEAIGRKLGELGEDTSGMHGADLHNWHFLHNMKKGLDFLLMSGGDFGPDSPDGKKAETYRKLFDAWAGSDMSSARAAADRAVAIDRGKSVTELFAPPPGLTDEAKALSVLSEDMFSDVLNPVMANRAKAYVKTVLGGADYMNIGKEARDLLADRYHLGVMQLMRQVMRSRPEIAPTQWASDDVLFKALDGAAAPLFAQAKAMSAELGAAKQAAALQFAAQKYRDALGIKGEYEDNK